MGIYQHLLSRKNEKKKTKNVQKEIAVNVHGENPYGVCKD